MSRSLLMSLMLWLAGCGVVRGNGQLQSQEHERTGFARVRSVAQFAVVVRDAAENKVVVTGDSNLLEYVTTRVEGDTLVIDDAKDGVWLMDSHIQVEVALPVARSLESSGSGSMQAELTAGGDLEVIHSGSGPVTVTGSFANLTTHSSGSGQATWTGAAGTWTGEMSGSGPVNARELSVDDARLTNSGSGNLSAAVQRTLEATVLGSGSIEWWGPAQLTASNDSGSGQLLHH